MVRSIEEIENQLIVDSISSSLFQYAIASYPGFIQSGFAESLSAEIQAAMTPGGPDRLMISAPPRHGKTLLTSEISPAWYMGNNSRHKVIAASHTLDLAEDNSVVAQRHLNSEIHRHVFGEAGSLNVRRATKSKFVTNMGGMYACMGVGGSVIGKGGNVYIIDDPVRGREDAESKLLRDKLMSWYSSAVLSRLEGRGVIILMHQRWHDDDLAGRLLKAAQDNPDKDQWRLINYPAIIEDDEDYRSDYLRRGYGEPLIPELFSKEKLLRLKNNTLPRDWLSMYQQKPRNAEGAEFTMAMISTYESDPESIAHALNVYILVDPANSKDKSSDYTAMAVIGLGADGNYYLLDMIRERLDLSERTQKLMQLHRKWRPIGVGYESYGAQSDTQHITYVQEQENYRFPIINVGKVSKLKKEERIRRLTPDMISGRWFFPEALNHIDPDGLAYDAMADMIDLELIPFPVGSHDDAIDALSRIYDMPIIWPSSASGSINNTNQSLISPW